MGMCWFNTPDKLLINKPFVGPTNSFLQCTEDYFIISRRANSETANYSFILKLRYFGHGSLIFLRLLYFYS